MTNTTSHDITTRQIRALRLEASAARDFDMVATCDAALSGDVDAHARCAKAIADARALDDA